MATRKRAAATHCLRSLPLYHVPPLAPIPPPGPIVKLGLPTFAAPLILNNIRGGQVYSFSAIVLQPSKQSDVTNQRFVEYQANNSANNSANPLSRVNKSAEIRERGFTA